MIFRDREYGPDHRRERLGPQHGGLRDPLAQSQHPGAGSPGLGLGAPGPEGAGGRHVCPAGNESRQAGGHHRGEEDLQNGFRGYRDPADCAGCLQGDR